MHFRSFSLCRFTTFSTIFIRDFICISVVLFLLIVVSFSLFSNHDFNSNLQNLIRIVASFRDLNACSVLLMTVKCFNHYNMCRFLRLDVTESKNE